MYKLLPELEGEMLTSSLKRQSTDCGLNIPVAPRNCTMVC